MIAETDSLVRQIKESMNEQTEGSKQINLSLQTLNDSTRDVRSASDTMTKGNKEVMDKVNQLQTATTEMAQTMCEMAFGTQRIVETGELLSSNARNVRNSVSKISEQIKQFKV